MSIEDFLIKVDRFVISIEFIILDFEVDEQVFITFVCLFLSTGETLINVIKKRF